MILGINHINLSVTDIHRSFDFYKNVLGFRPLVKWAKGAYFSVGDLWFCLNVNLNYVKNACYTHYAFTVTKENFNLLSQKLVRAGVEQFQENTSPGESLYFLDPDGHKLEIHTGDWRSRIEAKKSNTGTWERVEWFI